MNKSGFGNYFRETRLQQGLTLRAFSDRYGLDPAYISKLENEKNPPPKGDKLEALAEALNIKKNTKNWIAFFDLAHQARQEFPVDIQSEAREALNLLPAYLRTHNGKKISKDKV